MFFAKVRIYEALFKAKQELSRHNASLTQELHTTSSRLNEMSSRLDAVSKQNVVSDLRMKISTEILSSDKEAEFRRSFTAFYPDYIPALHWLKDWGWPVTLNWKIFWKGYEISL